MALGTGLYGVNMAVEGRSADLGRRNSGTIGLGGDEPALVPPTDSVPFGTLGSASEEVARELAARLLYRFRALTRR